jgi:hypothetical protein
VCVVFERLERPRVSLIFSHSGGSRASSVMKASWPAAGYTGATPATTKAKLDQQGSFEVTGSQEIVPDQHPRESTILDLGTKSFGLVETSTTDLSAPTIVLVHPCECQIVSHATMETNVVTPSGNSSIPTMVVTTGEFPPPNPPSPV